MKVHNCGGVVYQPAAIEGLEGEKVVMCGCNYLCKLIPHYTSYQMGPPNPKWWMGRSLQYGAVHFQFCTTGIGR